MNPESDTPALPVESESEDPNAGLFDDDHGTLGKYVLQRVLGTGGMGTVYLALDTELQRTVALKVLLRERAADPVQVQRFKSEAQSAAQLRHPNIVTVYEAGEADGLLYIAMEYIDGRDVLEMVLARGRLDVSQSAGIIRQSALALQHAYEKGIVHRDVKPSNLMIDRFGVVKLADMGLARSVDDTAEKGITRAGTTVGTVDYMSPEQALDSKAADIRSDIYSLGCSWYHMLTEQVPFPTGSLINKLYAHATRGRPDPRELNPKLPESVVRVLQRMMERSPSKRYQTPAEVVAAIDGLRNVGVKYESEEVFAAELAAVVKATPVLARLQRNREPEPLREPARSTKRRKGRKPPTLRERRERRERWRFRRPVIAEVVIIGLLAIGLAVWWARPNSTTPGDGVGEDVTQTDPPLVDPSAVDPSAVDPGPVDPPNPEPPVDDPPRGISPRLTIGRPDERPLMPDWVAEALLPEEAAQPPAELGLDVVGVGGPEGSESRYRDLNPALESAPPTGRAVRLNGPGPFLLDPLVLADRGHVVIAGAPSRSLVWVNAENAAGLDAILSLSRTSLTLVDVDLVVAGRPAIGSPPDLIEVSDGDLVLRRCSVTTRTGTTGGRSMRLLHVHGTAESEATGHAGLVLLDRVFTRGANTCVLEAVDADVLLWNCVLATGRGPVLEIGTRAAGPRPIDRRIDVFSSTLQSAVNGLEFTVPAGTVPTPTIVRVRNSIVATRETGGTLLRTNGWPTESVRTGFTAFGLAGLTWETTNSAYPGWEHAIHATSPDVDRVVDGDRGWQQVLERSVGPLQFPTRWPVQPVSSVESVDPALFDATIGSVARLKAEDGEAIGADVALVTAAAPELIASGERLAPRPGPLGDLVPQNPTPIRTSLGGRDLGRFVSSAAVPDGSHVIVTGRGSHPCTPFFLDGKSVRLEFQPDEDDEGNREELVVLVRGSQIDDAERRRGRTSAFITLKQGSLEIVNGRFRMLTTLGTPIEWFLHATDADFAFRGCEVRGPMHEAKALRELIRWRASPDSPTPHRAVFANSLLESSRPLLVGDLRHRTIVVRNSVLAAPRVLFDLDLTGFDPNLDVTFDVRDSTLACRGEFFTINGRDLPGRVRDPMRFFVDRTVFAEPIGFDDDDDDDAGDRGPVLFSVSEPIVRQEQIAWRGRDNAYSDRLHAYLVDRAVPDVPAQAFAADWQQRWGDGERRPLVAPIDFAAGGATRDYRLAPGSRAAGWRLDGGAVGADGSFRQASSETIPESDGG